MTNLEQLIEIITNKHVYIQTHNFPDQDALACAFGLQVLLQSKDISSTICYSGQVDKYNTQKMVEILPIHIVKQEDLKMEEQDEIILVDGQEGNKNVVKLEGKIIACIDHHPIQETKQYRFYDIRSELGACSSLIGKYFIDNQVTITKDVATALIYGIKMDTANLTRKVTQTDVDIFSHLFKFRNHEKLHMIENNSLRIEDLEAYQQAISNLKMNGRIGICKLGNDYSDAILGTISDLLITLAELDVTLVYTYRENGLKFSTRSTSPKIDAGILIHTALQGIGDGGGHETMAAGFAPNLTSDAEILDVGFLVEQRVIEFVANNQ